MIVNVSLLGKLIGQLTLSEMVPRAWEPRSSQQREPGALRKEVPAASEAWGGSRPSPPFGSPLLDASPLGKLWPVQMLKLASVLPVSRVPCVCFWLVLIVICVGLPFFFFSALPFFGYKKLLL